MAEGSRMWVISLITVLLLTLLSAAPIDIAGDIKKEDVKADNDGMHSHDENVTRGGKFFGHNQFDIRNINISGSVAGDAVSIGHEVKIDVHGHTHDHHHHEDDTVIECKEGLRELFKSIDSDKNGLMDVNELLIVCHQNNIQITESLAVRILTLPDKTVGFNMAKFCELLKDCQSTNSADVIYFLLQPYDKVSGPLLSEDQPQEGWIGNSILGSASTKYEVFCPYKDDLTSILLENNWRAQNQIDLMTEDQKSNIVIEKVKQMTSHTTADLKGRVNAGDLGSLTAIANMAAILIKYFRASSDVKTMTYDDLRNILIVETSRCFSVKVPLQSMTDHQLLKTFCEVCKGTHELRLYENFFQNTYEPGKSLTIYGPTDLYERNFKHMASSVHAVKGDWEIYRTSDYAQNRMVVKQGMKINLDLESKYLRDYKYNSARPICQYRDDPSTTKIRVYEHYSLQGDEKEFSNAVPNLGDDWSDKISSVHVIKGDWELYETINYGGVRAVVKEGEQTPVQFNDAVRSLRPICETYSYTKKCTPVSIEILNNPNSLLKFKGTKIIGTTSGFSCNDPSKKTLTLHSVNSVTNSISLSTSKSEGTNWSRGGSVSIKAGFPGIGPEFTGTVSSNQGGSSTVTHQKTESFSKGDSQLVGSTTTYQTPGAAIAFGTVDIYETDNSDVPVKIHSVCDGKKKEKRSTMKLTAHLFQSADFFDIVKEIDNADDCNKDGFITKIDECIRNVKARYINAFGQKEKMRKEFNDCFA